MGSRPTEHVETELKFEVSGDFVLPDLGSPANAVAMTEPEVFLLVASYFDTADLRLAKASITLRRRTGGSDAGWHLKLPVTAGTRRELQVPLGDDATAVPAQLASQVATWVRDEPLQVVAVLETRRTVRRLVPDPRGDLRGELRGHGRGVVAERNLQLAPGARGHRELQVPARVTAAGPAPERDAGLGQAQVGGVEVGGDQQKYLRVGHGHAVGLAAQVGQHEVAADLELQFGLEVLGRPASHACEATASASRPAGRPFLRRRRCGGAGPCPPPGLPAAGGVLPGLAEPMGVPALAL